MSKRYIIWKASIHEYRVQDTQTNEITITGNVTAINCSFHVDIEGYNKAQKRDFKDSGREQDYFAWIEADMVFDNTQYYHTFKDKVWYNPFLHSQFRDRITEAVVTKASVVCTIGNILTYTK